MEMKKAAFKWIKCKITRNRYTIFHIKCFFNFVLFWIKRITLSKMYFKFHRESGVLLCILNQLESTDKLPELYYLRKYKVLPLSRPRSPSLLPSFLPLEHDCLLHPLVDNHFLPQTQNNCGVDTFLETSLKRFRIKQCIINHLAKTAWIIKNK